MEFVMRLQLSLAILAATTLVGIGATAAAPVDRGIQDRYCLQGRIWGYPGNCQFSNYQQCAASASGTQASCGMNPRYAFEQQRGRTYR
jgi:hypothetical protein